jgi:hypothetical protein
MPPPEISLILDLDLGQVISELLLRGRSEHSGLPEVGGKEAVGLGERVEERHRQVTTSSGVAAGRRVYVLNASHGQQLLGDDRGDNARSSGSRDQTNADGAALAGHLAGHGVGGTRVGSPVSTANRDDAHLGVDNGTADSSCHLLRTLEAQTDVAVAVTHSDVRFEASALAGRSLLLHRHDLHHLVLEGGANEVINNLVLLDGEGEQEDLLNALDLSVLDKAAELGHGDPLLLVSLSFAAAASTTTSSATAAAISTASAAKSSSFRCRG